MVATRRAGHERPEVVKLLRIPFCLLVCTVLGAVITSRTSEIVPPLRGLSRETRGPSPRGGRCRPPFGVFPPWGGGPGGTARGGAGGGPGDSPPADRARRERARSRRPQPPVHP